MITNEAVKHLTEFGTPYMGAVLYIGRDSGRFYADLVEDGITTRVAYDSREAMDDAVRAHLWTNCDACGDAYRRGSPHRCRAQG